MKKCICIIALVMCFGLSACGVGDTKNDNEFSSQNETGQLVEDNYLEKTESEEKTELKEEKDPFIVTVAGENYRITAEDGIQNYGKMPNVARAFSGYVNGGLVKQREPYGQVLEQGMRSGREIELDEIYSIPDKTEIGRGSLIQAHRGTLQSSNGYELDVRSYRDVTLPATTFETDLAIYNACFLNDFNYMGVTQDSTISEIEDNGFRPSYRENVYYNIYSLKATDWEEICDTYQTLRSIPVTNKMIQENPTDYIPYGKQYIACGSFDSFDWTQFDMGFDGEGGAFCDEGYVKENANEYYREMYMAIGQQWYYMDCGDIDYFLVVEMQTPGYKYGKFFEKNTCHIYIFTSIENVSSWPEKWGWIPEETY